MPQISLAHAVARVRVLEGKLLKTEQLERLLTAPTLEDARKLLEELGYSGASDYETALAQARENLAAFLREVSPDVPATNSLLLEVDYQNAKLLYKARQLDQDVRALCADCGSLPLKLLADAIMDKDYFRLPEPLKSTLVQLDKAMNVQVDPGLIDVKLDQAWAQAVTEAAKGSLTLQAYFEAWIDITNLRSVLRAQRAKLTPAQTLAMLLPGGSISAEVLAKQAPEKALRLFDKKPYARDLGEALANGEAWRLEKLQADVVLQMLRAKRHETVAIEPLLGYYLARTREIEGIRLVMAARVNDFDAQAVRERLRELYV